MYNGIINIYKEAGYTSHDVVAKMRGICHQKKIGHTGTLDPQATGVLPICLGSGTKLCDFLTEKDKEYVAELLLGVTTDTQDMTGQVLDRRPVTQSQEEVREVIAGFVGPYNQVPPMYSAVKVDGKRLYELARAGREVERQARLVTIHEIEILEMNLPLVKMRVVCSKGAYIRTLCADIGERLGCGGAMESLVRTRSGRFGIEDALTLGQLQALREEGRIEDRIYPVDSVFEQCPALHVKKDFCRLIDNGNSFLPEQTSENCIYAQGEWIRVYNSEERFYGIYAWDGIKRQYKPVKMFPQVD